MNYKSIITASLLFLLTPAINAHSLKLPHKCPSANSVQAVASTFKVRKYDENYDVWYAYQNNKFDTKTVWTFMMTEVHAKNANEAYNKLMDSLRGLHFVSGSDVEDGSVECKYKTADAIKAAAVTPPVFQD